MISILAMLILPKHLIAEDKISKELIKPPTKSELIQKVYQYADKYKVSGKLMVDVINCEDKEWNPEQQSRNTLSYGREKSYGLVQIHLPDHPEVTYEQAIDPDFSIDFLASNLVKNKGSMWSCYRQLNR